MKPPIFFASILLVVAASTTSHAANDAMSDTARDLFVKGSNAASQQDWEGCRAALLAAWGIKPHWQIAGNLGGCEIELGRYRDAAEHLQYSISNAPADRTSNSSKLLIKAQLHVGTIRLEVEPQTATIDVDGVTLRDKAVPLFLDPGAHELRAAAGGATTTTSIDVTAGEDREVVLTVVGPVAPAPPEKSPVPPERHEAKRSIVPIVVGSAVAAVGVGVGVGLFAVAGGKQSDAEDLGAQIRSMGGTCGPVTSPASADLCAQTADLLSSKASLQTWGAVSVGVGAAAAVFAVTYALWPASPSKKTARGLHPVPWMSPDVGGLSLVGSF